MIRIRWALSLLVVVCILAHGDEPPTKHNVRELAKELGAATIQGDYAKVIDHTYGSVVELMGGRNVAIEILAKQMEKMKAEGLIIKEYRVGEPGEFLTEGENTFVIVPSSMKMAMPGGKILSKSFLLGISSDKGKTWKFIDGSGLVKNGKEVRAKWLPRLPANLKFPELEAPKMIEDK
ncbi:MAG: hypothetical protein QF752_09095 [Planctomycetota bacterium]|jgi:hypothetical protein|nr:hypothetical protein [Planctomycetota bacterium]